MNWGKTHRFVTLSTTRTLGRETAFDAQSVLPYNRPELRRRRARLKTWVDSHGAYPSSIGIALRPAENRP
jgi:hypothetical protein